MKRTSLIVLSVMLVTPSINVSAEDLTEQVKRQYEELKLLEEESQRLRLLKQAQQSSNDRMKRDIARNSKPIDGHKMLESIITKRVSGMASNPELICEFKVWMHETGSVDMIQRASCNEAVMGVIYSAVGEYQNGLNKYRYQTFNHPREEAYKVTIGASNKTKISRTYNTHN